MENLEFRALRRALGYTSKTLGERLEISGRTVRRWEYPTSGYRPAAFAADFLLERAGVFTERCAEVLDMAESLEVEGLPTILYAYDDEFTCMQRTGMSLEEHEALLAYIALCLEQADFDWQILPAPPFNDGEETKTT